MLLFLVGCRTDVSNNDSTKSSKVQEPLSKVDPGKQLVNDLKLSSLRGEVQKVVEKSYRSVEQLLNKKAFSITQTRFYENGNIQDMLTEMADGSSRTYNYRYSPDSIFVDNWLIENDTVIERQQFIYLRDQNGARYKMMLPARKGELPNYYADIRNNNEGLPTEYRHHLKNLKDRKQMPCKEVRKYDQNNFLISEEMHRYNPEDGSCKPTNTIRYYNNDEQGNCVEERIVKNGEQILSEHRYSYRYDAKGNWIEKKRYSEINGKEEITLITFRSFEFY
jgi:hypothetical protein